jgi:polysaccharide export outer membrane protein
MKRFLFLIIFAALGLSSCKTTNLFVDKEAGNEVADLDSIFLPEGKYEYHIRKDDKITVSIWGEDDLSVGSTYGIYNSNEVYGKWLMVDANGNIEIPKIGSVKVENMTIGQLKEAIEVRFGEWVKNPVVDIKILNREITVLGEVRDPQVINVDKERNTLLEMISRCKGLENYANAKNIKVMRQVGEDVYIANIDITENGDYLRKNINLYPGDVVVVPSKKNKEFDRRVSIIIPFATAITAAAILFGAF